MAKKFDLEAYKSSIKTADTPLKKDKYIVLDECLQEVLGLPGFPFGHVVQVFGKSDTSKTSLLFEAAAKCQAQGGMAVIIVTEGKISWERAAAMGFNKAAAIVNEDCEFLEDVFSFIDKICSDVANGDLPYDTYIFFDSIGNTLSKEEVVIAADGTYTKKPSMMRAAKVISENMRGLSKKINNTRKQSYPHFVGLFLINQAYVSPPSFPGGMPSLTPYGGTSVYYRSSLVIRTSRAKKLMAKKNGMDLGFGIVAKISVDKNHISNTTNSGLFVVTADSIIPNEKNAIAAYKNLHKEEWGNIEIVAKALDSDEADVDF
jgi:RecA/RadA recombinase